MLWTAPHTGLAFREDNRLVYQIYKDLMIGTDGYTWFSRAPRGNGRAAHLLIEEHYRGDAEVALRAASAEARMKGLFYKQQSSMPFEKYLTRLNECWELMEDNDQFYSDAQKVKKLLDGVKSEDPEVVAIKAVIRSTYPNNYNAASTMMSGQIAILFPGSHTDSNNDTSNKYKRKISAVNRHEGRGGRGRGRHTNNAGRGGRGRNQKLAGVDVSDPMRNFTTEEWRRLRESGFLPWLLDRRAALNRNGTGGHGPGGRTGRGGPNARGGRGNDGERHVTIGATEVIHIDGQNAAAGQNEEHQGGGHAGAGFGGGRYQTGRGRGGRR